jgi:hypothetical protein
MKKLFCLIAGVALVGCASKTRQDTFEFDDAVDRVEVALNVGDIKVTGRDGEQSAVGISSHWSGTRHPELEVRVEDGTLYVSADCGPLTMCIVDADINVPSGVKELSLYGQDGNVFVTGTDAKVEAAQAKGSIAVFGVGGDLELLTKTGTIKGMNLTSPSVEVFGRRGDIDLAFTDAPVDLAIDAGKGSVHLLLPDETYAVALDSESGDATIDIQRDPSSAHRVKVETTSGRMVIRPAPAEAAAEEPDDGDKDVPAVARG